MTEPATIESRLIALFPEFASQWDDDQNLFREDDGSFTPHGVFAEFSHFFRERFLELRPDRVQELLSQIEDWMTCGEADIENAVATCFVENIAGEVCASAVRDRLGPKSREYFDYWNGRENPDNTPRAGQPWRR